MTTSRKQLPDHIQAWYELQIARISDEPRFTAYRITNLLTSEQYIGISERKLKDRWRQHFRDGVNGKGYALHQAMHAQGVDTFRFDFIGCATSAENLGEFEKQLIAQYQTVENGYNLTRGGSASDAKGNEVTVEGQTFISFNAACRHYGIDEHLGHGRVNRLGWTIKQALEIDPAPNNEPRRNPYRIEGVEYPNFKAACKHYGLEDSAVRSRLKADWSVEQAFGLEPPPRRIQEGTVLTLEGKHYPNAALAAEAYGLKQHTITRRLRAGWTPEQAVELVPAPKTVVSGTEISYEGISYPSIAELCREIDVDYNLVRARLERNWTLEQAIGEHAPPPHPGEKTGRPITVEGVEYSSLKKAAEAYGLSAQNTHKRLHKFGWTIEQAFNLAPPPEKPSNSAIAIVIEGKEYHSIDSAAKAYGITVSTVTRRRKKGMSIEEAITTPGRKKK